MTTLRDWLYERIAEDGESDEFYQLGMKIVSGYNLTVDPVNYFGIQLSTQETYIKEDVNFKIDRESCGLSGRCDNLSKSSSEDEVEELKILNFVSLAEENNNRAITDELEKEILESKVNESQNTLNSTIEPGDEQEQLAPLKTSVCTDIDSIQNESNVEKLIHSSENQSRAESEIDFLELLRKCSPISDVLSPESDDSDGSDQFFSEQDNTNSKKKNESSLIGGSGEIYENPKSDNYNKDEKGRFSNSMKEIFDDVMSGNNHVDGLKSVQAESLKANETNENMVIISFFDDPSDSNPTSGDTRPIRDYVVPDKEISTLPHITTVEENPLIEIVSEKNDAFRNIKESTGNSVYIGDNKIIDGNQIVLTGLQVVGKRVTCSERKSTGLKTVNKKSCVSKEINGSKIKGKENDKLAKTSTKMGKSGQSSFIMENNDLTEKRKYAKEIEPNISVPDVKQKFSGILTLRSAEKRKSCDKHLPIISKKTKTSQISPKASQNTTVKNSIGDPKSTLKLGKAQGNQEMSFSPNVDANGEKTQRKFSDHSVKQALKKGIKVTDKVKQTSRVTATKDELKDSSSTAKLLKRKVAEDCGQFIKLGSRCNTSSVKVNYPDTSTPVKKAKLSHTKYVKESSQELSKTEKIKKSIQVANKVPKIHPKLIKNTLFAKDANISETRKRKEKCRNDDKDVNVLEPKRHSSRHDTTNQESETSYAAEENKQSSHTEKSASPEDRKVVSYPQGKDSSQLNLIPSIIKDCSTRVESSAKNDSENKYSPSFRPYIRCHICVDLYFSSQERFNFHNKVTHNTHNTKKINPFGEGKQISSSITTSPQIRQNLDCSSHDLWNELGTPEKVRHVLSSIIGDDSIRNKDSSEAKTYSVKYDEESRIQRKELGTTVDINENQERNRNVDDKNKKDDTPSEEKLGGQTHDHVEYNNVTVDKLSGLTEMKIKTVISDSQKCKISHQKSKGYAEIDCRMMTQKSQKSESRKPTEDDLFENPNKCKDTNQPQDKHNTHKDSGKNEKLSLNKPRHAIAVMNDKANAQIISKVMSNEPSQSATQSSQSNSNTASVSNKNVIYQKSEKGRDKKVAISIAGDITSTQKHKLMDKSNLNERGNTPSKRNIFKSSRHNLSTVRNSKKTRITQGDDAQIIKTETVTDNSKSIKAIPKNTYNENINNKSKQSYDRIQKHKKDNTQKDSVKRDSDKREIVTVREPSIPTVVHEKVVYEKDCQMATSKSSYSNLNLTASPNESVSCQMAKDTKENNSTSVLDISLDQELRSKDTSHLIGKGSRPRSGEHSLSAERIRKKYGIKHCEQDQDIGLQRGMSTSKLVIKEESKESLNEDAKRNGKYLEKPDSKSKKSLVQHLFHLHDDPGSDKDSMRVCVDSQSSDECLDSDLEQIGGFSAFDFTKQIRQHEHKAKEENEKNIVTVRADETVERRSDGMQRDNKLVSYVCSNSIKQIHAFSKNDFDKVDIDKEGEKKRNSSSHNKSPDSEDQERNPYFNINQQSHKEKKHHRKIIYPLRTRNRHNSRNIMSIDNDKDVERESNEINASEKSRGEKRDRDSSCDDSESLQERERKRHSSTNSKTSDSAKEERRRHCSNNSRTSGGAMETETRLNYSNSSNLSEGSCDRKRHDCSPKGIGKDRSISRKRHESASIRRRHGSATSVGSRNSVGRVNDKNEERKHYKYDRSPERRKQSSTNDRSEINSSRRSRSRSRERFGKQDRRDYHMHDPNRDRRSRNMSVSFKSSRFHNKGGSFRENIGDRRSIKCDRRNLPHARFSFSKYDKNIRYRYSKIDIATKRKERTNRIKNREKQIEASRIETQYKNENKIDISAENATKCDQVSNSVENEKIEHIENISKKNTEESHLCPKCKEEFKTYFGCQKHMFNEHLAVFKCYQCKLGFATPDEHGSHVSTRHERKRSTERNKSVNEIQKTRVSKEPAEPSKPHYNDRESVDRETRQEDRPREEEMIDFHTFCRICHTEFRTRRELLDHLWFRHNKRVFDSSMNKRPPPLEHASGYDPSLTCRICHLRLRSKDELFKHLERKHDFHLKDPRGKQMSLKGLQHL